MFMYAAVGPAPTIRRQMVLKFVVRMEKSPNESTNCPVTTPRCICCGVGQARAGGGSSSGRLSIESQLERSSRQAAGGSTSAHGTGLPQVWKLRQPQRH